MRSDALSGAGNRSTARRWRHRWAARPAVPTPRIGANPAASATSWSTDAVPHCLSSSRRPMPTTSPVRCSWWIDPSSRDRRRFIAFIICVQTKAMTQNLSDAACANEISSLTSASGTIVPVHSHLRSKRRGTRLGAGWSRERCRGKTISAACAFAGPRNPAIGWRSSTLLVLSCCGV